MVSRKRAAGKKARRSAKGGPRPKGTRTAKAAPKQVWWMLPLGLALAAGAAWLLLSAGTAQPPAVAAPGGEIGDDSREALRRILRDADDPGSAP